MIDTNERMSPVMLQTFVAEGFFLPLAAMVAATGLAAACFRGAAFVTGLEFGWLPYALIALAGATGAAATALQGVLNLPYTLRAADFFGLHIISAIVLGYTPYAPGAFQAFGAIWVVNLTSTGMIAIFLAWLFSTLLTMVVPQVFPVHVSRSSDPALTERLEEEGRMREVYSGGVNSELAREKSWNRAYQATLTIVLLYLAFTLTFPAAGNLRTDTVLAAWSGITFTGIISYLALTQLASRRRSIEQHGLVVVPPGYAQAWGLGVFAPVVIAAVLGFVLPINISPLDSLDYNDLMDRLTKTLVGFFFRRTVNGPAYGDPLGVVQSGSMGGANQFVGGAGSSGGTGPIGPLVMLALLATIYMGYKFIRSILKQAELVKGEEADRSRGLWALLKAILMWPFRALLSLFRTLSKDSKEQRAKDKSLGNRLIRGLNARRRRWLYPDDPVLFVRFIYRRYLNDAAQTGAQRGREQTALEYARSITQLFPEANTPVDELTQTYCAARYTIQTPEEGMRGRVLGLLRLINRAFRIRKRSKE